MQMATKMKKSLFVFYLILLLGTAFSFAEEAEEGGVKQDSTQQVSKKSRVASMPWSLSVGFGAGYSISTEWIFGDLAGIWYSEEGDENFPKHFLIWAVRNQLAWYGDDFGVFWEPNIQYTYGGMPFFVLSVGPEIGFWTDKTFDYGFTVRIGTLFNLVMGEIGYFVNKQAFVLHLVLNLPIGLGYFV